MEEMRYTESKEHECANCKYNQSDDPVFVKCSNLVWTGLYYDEVVDTIKNNTPCRGKKVRE